MKTQANQLKTNQNAYIDILNSYRFGIFERLWIRFESRSMDKKTSQIIAIAPVIIFMQKEHTATLINTLYEVLQNYLKPHLVSRVSRHIILRLKEYAKNEYLFLQARDKAMDCLCQNIQLYGLVLDLCTEDSKHIEIIEQVIRKRFDKEYSLNAESMRLLDYQEKYCETL